MSDIRVCEEDQVQVPGDVRICNEESVQPGDIRICNDDEDDPCLDSSVPVIAGDGDGNVGDIYTASGGLPPYAWSFDSGGIDSNGEITSINSCSAPGELRGGVITVTDSCGRSSNLTIRLPGGTWVKISDPPRGSYFWGVNGTDCATKFTNAHICEVGSLTTINGTTQIIEGWNCIDGRDDSELCPIDTPVASTITSCSLCTTSSYTIPIQSFYRTYEWQCP